MSDITDQQFDQEDFWPFVRPWSITILCFYLIYTIIVVPLLIWRSNFHPLRLRPKGYMFVTIFAQLFMVCILSLRIAIGRQIFPCVLYYIFAFFGVPMFMFPYIMQSFQLIMVTRLGKMKQEMINFDIPEQKGLTNNLTLFKTSIFNGNNEEHQEDHKRSVIDMVLDKRKSSKPKKEDKKNDTTIELRDSTEFTTSEEKNEPTIKEEEKVKINENNDSTTIQITEKQEEEDTFNSIMKDKAAKKALRKLRTFNLLKMYVSSSFQLTIFTIAMLFQGVLFCLFNTIFYDKLFLLDQGCVLEFYAGIVIVIVSVVYFVVLGLELAYILFFTKEEFKIRQEIFLNIMIWAFFGALFLAFGLIPQWNREYEYYFSAVWTIVFACFFSNFVATVIPIIRTFIWSVKKKLKKKKLNPDQMPESRKLLMYMAIDHSKKTEDPNATDFNSISHLQACLESKTASPYLLEYCKREWSSENFLFLEQLNSYKKLTDRESQLKYGLLIFDTFISKTASLELNINQRLRVQVKKVLDEESDKKETEELIPHDVFYKVEVSITNLMLDTWGKKLYRFKSHF
eukprot:gene7559-11882_t